ncbi:beta-lactamase/transpeptidase-like protein [Trametes coccinea BRFM310]|uniref:Beta-lactamase/transpeptidase-like protein n=1 Tax=Trametes coccinea (strain BRFM310) TaxID=1353009 RepID=A0A1Y2I8G6_TRAC3|nr:beta-lactamase/transpeptidase-like protein [Trametes coccinea BRFM310]
MLAPLMGVWMGVVLQLLPVVNAGNSVVLRKVITSDVSRFVEDVLNASTIPGLSMGVVRLDNVRQPVVELAAWGRRTEDGDRDDLTPDTLFALASCSKAFLVTSIGLLMDDYAHGRNVTPLPPSVEVFDWDTKMHDLLPGEWALEDPWASEKANLRDAFGHVTGLPRHDYSYRPGDNAEDVVLRMRHLPPAYELREKWSYNNQVYANATIGSFVVSRIFKPLNMSFSSYTPSEAAKSGRLTQTWTPHRVRRIPYWLPDKVNDLFAGPGGAISSAEDMTKWLATLLNEGVDPRTNRTIIPASTFANMTTARAIQNGVSSPDTSITGYGMGWFRMTYKGRDVVWHSGAIPGFSLLVAFLPEDNLGVVLLANMDDKADDVMSVLYRVIDEALDLPEDIGRGVGNGIPQTPLLSTQKGYVTEVPPKPLPMPLEAYAGLYANIAYGNITLCTPANTSSYCSHVLAQFAPVEAASGEHLPEARLYAAWQRVWSTHLRVLHTSANSFDLVLPALFPNGYGRNKSAFEYHDPVNSVGRVEFLVGGRQVRGFALITEEDAAEARAARTNGTIQEIGDAWFDKL